MTRGRLRAVISHAKGFTLIELMIVVVVVGILAAIAMPSYLESVRRSKRADAKGFMMQVAQQEERYYTENYKYGTLQQIGYAGGTAMSSNNNYTITIAAGTSGVIDTSYTITATPAVTDATCGNLTLTNTGVFGNSMGASATSC